MKIQTWEEGRYGVQEWLNIKKERANKCIRAFPCEI